MRGLIALGLVALVACGDDDGGSDGGTDGVALCAMDSDCSDELFCNGTETCDPSSEDADSQGCVTTPSCMPTQTCDETTDECITDCDNPDADGDGARAASCGGADCDDADPLRFPGATEVCDAENRDEDCDPATFGFRDIDGDGFPDDRCCNDDGGTLNCGTDCDDTLPAVHPTLPEVCDTLDNDCDGDVDEGALVEYWPDADGDGRGTDDAAAVPMLACSTPPDHAELRGDCNDGNPAIAEGMPELCDGLGLDEDCDEMVDEGERVDCYPDADDDTYAVAGASTMMVCRDATRGAVGGCPVNFTNRVPTGATNQDCDDLMLAVNPAASESCNGMDDDCDGTDDNGFFCASGSTRSCTTSAACGSLSGSQTCAPDCGSYSPCSLASEGPAVAGTCNACDDDLDGDTDEGFACERDSTRACTVPVCGTSGNQTCGSTCVFGSCVAAEMCNFCDDDGDGSIRGDEVGMTTTFNTDFDPVGSGVTLVQGFAEFLAAIVSSGDNALSVAELTQPVTMGYGTVTFESQVLGTVTTNPSATPAHGWTIFMYREGEGSATTPTASSFAAPTNRNGFVGQWQWRGAVVDLGVLVQIRASASDPAIGSRSMSTSLTVGDDPQEARFVITPDNPDTAQDETRVDFEAGPPGSFTRIERCDNRPGGDPDCGHTISPGENWRFGISHAGGSGNLSRTILTVTRTQTTLQANSVCP